MNNDDHQVYILGDYNRKTALLPICFWVMCFCILIACVRISFNPEVIIFSIFIMYYMMSYAATWDFCMRERVGKNRNVTLSNVWVFLFVSVYFLCDSAVVYVGYHLYSEGIFLSRRQLEAPEIYPEIWEKISADDIVALTQLKIWRLVAFVTVWATICFWAVFYGVSRWLRGRKELKEDRRRYERSTAKMLQERESAAGILQREGD